VQVKSIALKLGRVIEIVMSSAEIAMAMTMPNGAKPD
jgi:hypothetical protein